MKGRIYVIGDYASCLRLLGDFFSKMIASYITGLVLRRYGGDMPHILHMTVDLNKICSISPLLAKYIPGPIQLQIVKQKEPYSMSL